MLFLDEFTEFRRDAIEGLRQPLEDGRVGRYADDGLSVPAPVDRLTGLRLRAVVGGSGGWVAQARKPSLGDYLGSS